MTGQASHDGPGVAVPALSRRQRRRAPGRDRDHHSPRRGRQIKLRYTDTEYNAIAQAARHAGLTPTGYAADAALAAATEAAAPALAPWRTALQELMEARNQVRRIGTNINQAARTLNTGGDEPIWLHQAAAISARSLTRLDTAAEALHALGRSPAAGTTRRARPGPSDHG
jgi:uncharacterized protein (DUF1778 family)